MSHPIPLHEECFFLAAQCRAQVRQGYHKGMDQKFLADLHRILRDLGVPPDPEYTAIWDTHAKIARNLKKYSPHSPSSLISRMAAWLIQKAGALSPTAQEDLS